MKQHIFSLQTPSLLFSGLNDAERIVVIECLVSTNNAHWIWERRFPHDIHPYFRINTDRDKNLEIIRFGILRQYLLSGCLHLSIFVPPLCFGIDLYFCKPAGIGDAKEIS